MCGITGAISLQQQTINTHYAKPMADKIAHRGPQWLCLGQKYKAPVKGGV